eukprot:snap_masked-scaffold_10-processed-gene-4.48-mRNA-1 protein AED:1.00 eAED:1.00 QI:0/-1/0/0/-1/1/1/0/186
MKFPVLFALASGLGLINASNPLRRDLQDDSSECVRGCRERMRRGFIDQYNALDDEDIKNVIKTSLQLALDVEVDIVVDTMNEINIDILIDIMIELNIENCVEELNENAHRVSTCQAACDGAETCEDLAEDEVTTFVEEVEKFECTEKVDMCTGLEEVVDEINGVVEQGLGVAALGMSVLALVGIQH